MLLELGIGLLISFGIAFLAYLKRSLTIDGLWTAALLGTIIYAFGGITVWGVLIAFFISSSLLTKLHEKKEKDQNQGRNYRQVIANGIVAAICVVLYEIFQLELFMLAAVVSIASANSDTWASEIGALSKGKTINIMNLKWVPKGVSGAISRLGTFASLLGALFIALVFIGLLSIKESITVPLVIEYVLIITLCGFIGNLIDSLLGASLQAKYQGMNSGQITEQSYLPNEKVILISGLVFMTNDTVNFLSSFAASLLSLIFFI
jgi:uncharacterized protein (TIGR00297 family)